MKNVTPISHYIVPLLILLPALYTRLPFTVHCPRSSLRILTWLETPMATAAKTRSGSCRWYWAWYLQPYTCWFETCPVLLQKKPLATTRNYSKNCQW
jgi:hypothetical protein